MTMPLVTDADQAPADQPDTTEPDSPVASMGSTPEPDTPAETPPPMPMPAMGGGAPPMPFPQMPAGQLNAPPPAMGQQPPNRLTAVLQALGQALPQLAMATLAHRQNPATAGHFLMGYAQGQQQAEEKKLVQDQAKLKQTELQGAFVNNAVNHLRQIAIDSPELLPAAAQALDQTLVQAFGGKPGTITALLHGDAQVSQTIPKKVRDEAQKRVDDIIKSNPPDVLATDPIVSFNGKQYKFSELQAVAGSALRDPNTGKVILPTKPDDKPPTDSFDRYAADAIAAAEEKAGHPLTRTDKAQIRLTARKDWEAAGAKPPTPKEPTDPFNTALRTLTDSFTQKNGRDPNPDEQLKLQGQAKELGKDPQMADLLKGNEQLRNLLLQNQLGQQPTKDDARVVAQQLVTHTMAPSQLSLFGGFGTAGQAFKRSVLIEAQKIDPAFNMEEAESTYQLVKSPSFQNTVRYMDSTIESMPRLIQSAKALDNGNVRGLNALITAGKDQINNVDLKKFNVDRLAVADEVAKILQGGGTGSGTTDAKLSQASELLKKTDSPKAIAAALDEISFMIGNRRKSLTRGTYLDRPAAADTSTGSGVTVTAPSGKAYSFKSQADADAFVAKAKAQGLWK